MNDSIDPIAAFQALQQFTAGEIARLYGEIAARDALIAQLRAQPVQE
jgi:hypothetical protein